MQTLCGAASWSHNSYFATLFANLSTIGKKEQSSTRKHRLQPSYVLLTSLWWICSMKSWHSPQHSRTVVFFRNTFSGNFATFFHSAVFIFTFYRWKLLSFFSLLSQHCIAYRTFAWSAGTEQAALCWNQSRCFAAELGSCEKLNSIECWLLMC